jgi:hypothetical protein
VAAAEVEEHAREQIEKQQQQLEKRQQLEQEQQEEQQEEEQQQQQQQEQQEVVVEEAFQQGAHPDDEEDEYEYEEEDKEDEEEGDEEDELDENENESDEGEDDDDEEEEHPEQYETIAFVDSSNADSNSKWACSKCTFMNKGLKLCCEMCGGKKVKPRPRIASVESSRELKDINMQVGAHEAPPDETDGTDRNETAPSKKRVRSEGPCGQCEGCTNPDNCGECINCLDMPRFGGQGTRRQKCERRRCSAAGKTTKKRDRTSAPGGQEEGAAASGRGVEACAERTLSNPSNKDGSIGGDGSIGSGSDRGSSSIGSGSDRGSSSIGSGSDRGRKYVRPDFLKDQPCGRKPTDKALYGIFDEQNREPALTKICCEEFTMVPYTRMIAAEQQLTRTFLTNAFTIATKDTFQSSSKYTILAVFDNRGLERAITSCVAIHFLDHQKTIEISMLKTGKWSLLLCPDLRA